LDDPPPPRKEKRTKFPRKKIGGEKECEGLRRYSKTFLTSWGNRERTKVEGTKVLVRGGNPPTRSKGKRKDTWEMGLNQKE